MRFIGRKNYRHDQQDSIGILLCNLGTPDEPTPGALRRYLREFLWDPRVVEIPRWLWWLILHLIVLRIRPAKSARVYKKIWQSEGSPLWVNSLRQAKALNIELQSRTRQPVCLELGMRYGAPSITQAIQKLYEQGASRLLVLPLYPQYSGSTTASAFDAVFDALKSYRWMPELRCVNQYADDEKYIDACASQIRHYWEEHGRPQKLVMSFHGIPRRYLLNGDPYHCQCHKTARLIAADLQITDEEWTLTFQSRFGKAEWLKPYTDHYLQSLPQQGVTRVDVFCPGFSADCVETLEEIDMQNREFFLSAGGEQFRYIPALNDNPEHIHCLLGLVESHTQGWGLFGGPSAMTLTDEELQQRRRRAMALGAKK